MIGRVLKQSAGLILCLALTVAAGGDVAAQQPTSPSPAVVTFPDVIKLLRTGKSEKEILDVLAKSPIDVNFVLGDSQVDELKKMRVSDEFIAALKQLKKPAAGQANDVSDLVLILDCSGSMMDKTKDGSTKMDGAKQALVELIQDFPAGRRLAFIIYGHDKKRECQAVDVVRPLSPLDEAGKGALKAFIGRLQPVGHTPIARALDTAAGELAKATGLSKVVLITDGMETCHGDPVRSAAALVEKTKADVDIIGFVLKPEESKAVDLIAKAGRGKYYDAQTVAALRKDLRRVAQVPPQPKKAEAPPPVQNEEPAGALSPIEKVLIENLTDKDREVREQAAEGLRQRKTKAAVPFLVKRVGDELVENRFLMGDKNAALKALKELAPDKVVEALLPSLQSPTEDMRVWSANALAKEKNQAAVPALMRRVADDLMDNPFITRDKDAALDALKQLAPNKVEEALLEATKSKNATVKAWALKRLTAKD